MKLETIYRTLKTGEELEIRSLSSLDAEKALSFMVGIYSESNYLACYPEEFILTVEDEKAFIERQVESQSMLQLAVFLENFLVGMAQLSAISGRIKLRHRAECSISVLASYQGKGIATELMDVLIKEAKTKGFSQLELEVVSQNKKAIFLYEKLGFKRVGSIPNGMKLKDGCALDLDIMVLDLT